MSHLAKVAALAATSVLTLGALPAGTAHAAAAPSYDPAPVAAGSSWLTGQLTDGILHNDQYDFDDYGLTVDAGLALHAIGDSTAVSTISTAFAPHVADYDSYEVDDASGAKLGTHISAGSVAKALVFAQAAGADPKAYGGHDLVTELQDRLQTSGRIADQVVAGGSFEADYANTIGQAFAVEGLTAASSPQAASTLDYLLGQQCKEGFFRLDLGATTADTCDAASPAATPSVDTTALVVLQLEGDPLATQAVTKAVDWLKSQQAADGSFTDGTGTGTANANSTGLAGWALGTAGDTADAAKAAGWVRALQAADPAACRTKLTPDDGAIAFDAAARDTARVQGITDTTSDQFRRATTQALPALQWAPAGTAVTLTLRHHGFVRSGKKLSLSVRGGAPGGTYCLKVPGQRGVLLVVGLGTTDIAPFAVGSKPGVGKVKVTTTKGTVVTKQFRVVKATRLQVRGASRPAVGTVFGVTVRGLAPREPVTLRLNGERVSVGSASKNGVYRTSVVAPRRAGTVALKATGAFGDRTGTTHVKVVKKR